MDDHDVVDDRHDLDYPYIIDGRVADGDELTGDERVGGEGIVVCGRRVAECAEGSNIDQRTLERSTSAVFGDSASGGGESFGDSAWSSPGDDVRTSSSGVFQLFLRGGHINFDTITNFKFAFVSLLIQAFGGGTANVVPIVAGKSVECCSGSGNVLGV